MKTITSIESNENFSNNVQAWQLKNMIGETVTIHGNVYKIRKMHGFAFVLLRSGGETSNAYMKKPEQTSFRKTYRRVLYKGSGLCQRRTSFQKRI